MRKSIPAFTMAALAFCTLSHIRTGHGGVWLDKCTAPDGSAKYLKTRRSFKKAHKDAVKWLKPFAPALTPEQRFTVNLRDLKK